MNRIDRSDMDLFHMSRSCHSWVNFCSGEWKMTANTILVFPFSKRKKYMRVSKKKREKILRDSQQPEERMM